MVLNQPKVVGYFILPENYEAYEYNSLSDTYIRRIFEKGTELPIVNINGKLYLDLGEPLVANPCIKWNRYTPYIGG